MPCSGLQGFSIGGIKPEDVWVDLTGPRPFVRLAGFLQSTQCTAEGQARDTSFLPWAGLLHELAVGGPIVSPPELLDYQEGQPYNVKVGVTGALVGCNPALHACPAEVAKQAQLPPLSGRGWKKAI